MSGYFIKFIKQMEIETLCSEKIPALKISIWNQNFYSGSNTNNQQQ